MWTSYKGVKKEKPRAEASALMWNGTVTGGKNVWGLHETAYCLSQTRLSTYLSPNARTPSLLTALCVGVKCSDSSHIRVACLSVFTDDFHDWWIPNVVKWKKHDVTWRDVTTLISRGLLVLHRVWSTLYNVTTVTVKKSRQMVDIARNKDNFILFTSHTSPQFFCSGEQQRRPSWWQPYLQLRLSFPSCP